MVQSTSVRISISERVSEVSPTPSTVLADEVSGVIVGCRDARRQLAGERDSRSPTTWRLR